MISNIFNQDEVSDAAKDKRGYLITFMSELLLMSTSEAFKNWLSDQYLLLVPLPQCTEE